MCMHALTYLNGRIHPNSMDGGEQVPSVVVAKVAKHVIADGIDITRIL